MSTMLQAYLSKICLGTGKVVQLDLCCSSAGQQLDHAAVHGSGSS